ncbi:hypothetical protein BDY24DRAFT_170905 [Mrakia frigida]|uniref:uncharacterized protein n=1 Tax=Mrakia frigida TaxID=29902 RepID=UPI003FCC0F3B
MPSPPPILLSLNYDVLREILQILLLDTPRALNRTSILRTCSTLHLLGLPHLYRIVDLTGYPTRDTVMTHWKTLFGEGGVLTVEGRNGEVGSFVSELRLGPSPPGGGKDYVLGFKVPRLNLPTCSSLLLPLFQSRPPLLSSFPPHHPPTPTRSATLSLRPHFLLQHPRTLQRRIAFGTRRSRHET